MAADTKPVFFLLFSLFLSPSFARLAFSALPETQDALKALRTIPGCERAKLRTFSNNLGVRDSRKCLGRYQLTGEDVLAGARFDDTVCVLPQIVDGYAPLSIHLSLHPSLSPSLPLSLTHEAAKI